TSTQNYVDGEIIVRFKPHNETQNLQNSENQSQGNLVPLMSDGLYKIEAPSSMSTKELYDYYKDLDNVESVSFNRTGQLLRLPNDSHIDLQWNLHNINLPLAWNLGTGSKDVKVAILDTGYISHPDINDNIISGYDFVGNNVYDEGDYDNNPYDDDAYYHSEYDNRVSHGTHIAGIIGAKGNNEYGIAGMNWNVKMMPIRIFHVRNSMQEFEEANLINGIYYAIENEADVINLSLAFINNSNDPANYPDIETALEEAYNNDITVIAAAGNDGLNKVYYPASSQYTIAVGASTLDNKRAEYSNYGQSLDLYAPGGSLYEDDIYLDDKNSDNQPDGILSTHNYVNKKEDNYIYMAGTSVAAAQASGVAALLYSHGFNDPDTVRNILKETSIKGVDLGGTAPGDAGLINAHAAVNYDTPTDMKKIKVMAGAEVEDENGNSIFYVMSNVAGVDENGNYELKHIKTDYDLVIFAWLDQDDDNMIDRKEDYLGKYENFDDPVVFNLYQNEHIDDIDFVIKPQQTNSTAEFSDKVYNDILYSPPPDLIKKGDK
ncbi:MAG: S8 family serine peptidase, partial [Halanaerobiaceae bacterium]